MTLCACGDHAWGRATKGWSFIIDPECASIVGCYNWSATVRPGMAGVTIARTEREGGKVRHRTLTSEVLGLPTGTLIDHASGQTWDNRKGNLRPATLRQNNQNCRGKSSRRSRFKGISFDPKRKKWQACVRMDGKKVYWDRFDDERVAAEAYDQAAVRAFGEFARTNEMMGLFVA